MNGQHTRDDILRMASVMNALPGFQVLLRRDGTWYATVSARITEDGFSGAPTHSEETPNEAIAELFFAYTLKGVCVTFQGPKGRRDVTWNGFLWEDVA